MIHPCLKEDNKIILLLSLRIPNAYLEILGFPMGGAYQYRDILRGLKQYMCVGKAEVGKCFWYPKRKLGVAMLVHFSEIIKYYLKLMFNLEKKKRHTLLCILLLFRIFLLLNYL